MNDCIRATSLYELNENALNIPEIMVVMMFH